MPATVYPLDKPIEAYGLSETKGDIALEMEVEGSEQLPNLRSKMWTTHNDGSLRLNGKEYVNNGPLPRTKVLESLLNWEARIVKSEATIYNTDRTSVHVHMNMQNKTFKEIIQGCVAYYILENALMRYCGPSRMTNLFCLPLKQSKGQLVPIKYFANKFSGGNLRTDTYRYSALNLMALLKFGSVEHRGMRGYYEPKFLDQWAQNLFNIFERASTEFKSPVEVLDYYYGRSYKDYMGTFLSGDFIDELTKLKDWDIDKSENLSTLGPVIYELDFDVKRPEKDVIKAKKYVDDQDRIRDLYQRMTRPAANVVYTTATFNTATDWVLATVDNNIPTPTPRRQYYTRASIVFNQFDENQMLRDTLSVYNTIVNYYSQLNYYENEIPVDYEYEDEDDDYGTPVYLTEPPVNILGGFPNHFVYNRYTSNPDEDVNSPTVLFTYIPEGVFNLTTWTDVYHITSDMLNRNPAAVHSTRSLIRHELANTIIHDLGGFNYVIYWNGNGRVYTYNDMARYMLDMQEVVERQ